MSLAAPARLWLLVLPVALVVAYLLVQRLRRRHAARFTNVELLASVAPRRPGWRRHLSAALLVAAVLALVVSIARPVLVRHVPKQEGTVVLAIDVSTSMEATDVSPSRLAAAQGAAEQFAVQLPDGIRLGLVSFAGTARVVVNPTTDRAQVVRAIQNLRLAPSTAIGEGIFASLDAITASLGTDNVAPDPVPPYGTAPTTPTTPPNGQRSPAHIVLMSDGTTTVGRPNGVAVDAARQAGVPVSTIAFGTDNGVVDVQGRAVRVPVDADALRQIADDTGGRFFEAASAGQLRSVYADIGRTIGFDTRHDDVTLWFAGLGLALAVVAAGASMLWMARLP